MFTEKFIQYVSALMIFGCLIAFGPGQAIAAVEDTAKTDDMMTVGTISDEATGNADEWEYVFEDRPDPFLPFIQPAVAETAIPGDEEEDIILTGMQLFEPGQLRLVAIMFTPNKRLAMVEDVTGKGYVIDEGTLIGRYGIVSQINLDQVNITETRKVGGKEIVTPVVMSLNKEGDK